MHKTALLVFMWSSNSTKADFGFWFFFFRERANRIISAQRKKLGCILSIFISRVQIPPGLGVDKISTG